MTGSMVGACVAASRPKKPLGSLPSWVAGQGYNMILSHPNCPMMTAPTAPRELTTVMKVRGYAQLSALLAGTFNVQADKMLTLSKNCSGSGICMFPGPGPEMTCCVRLAARPATLNCSA